MNEQGQENPKNRLPNFLQNRAGETAVGAALGALGGLAWGETAKYIAEDVNHYPEHLQNLPVITGPIVGALAMGLAFSRMRRP